MTTSPLLGELTYGLEDYRIINLLIILSEIASLMLKDFRFEGIFLSSHQSNLPFGIWPAPTQEERQSHSQRQGMIVFQVDMDY